MALKVLNFFQRKLKVKTKEKRFTRLAQFCSLIPFIAGRQ
jgi:hypothetical protein